MKIGLYFGSFNPVHIGHLIIAEHVLTHTDFQQVWFVISPQNPFKEKSTLLNEYDRLHLLNLSIKDNHRLKVSDVEFKLPKPSYTVTTLAYLKEKYPQHSFSIIIGSDSFKNLNKWKNFEHLISQTDFVVYKRLGFEISQNNVQGDIKFKVLENAPVLDISATYIRNCIKQRKSIRYLVHEEVYKEIETNRYFY